MIIDRLKNKKIVILGFGREGKSSLNYIRKFLPNEIIAIADDNIDKIEIDDDNIVKCSKNYLEELENYDIILKSPGIPVKDGKYDKVLEKISSQTDLFIDEYRDKIIGITGTKGKSTTSSLIYHILKTNNKDVILAGNIGLPVFDIIDDIKDNTTIVFELSSHQLEFVHSSPHIGILLNIYEEHLDHYDSFEAYQNCKKNIYKYMINNDYLIYNPDNEYLSLGKYISHNVMPITNNKYIKCNNYVSNKVIKYDNNNLDLSQYDIKLLGDHNYLNISFAYIVSKLYEINDLDFVNALQTFKPLPHRMEYIGESRGNKYYNDSISTIPEATIKAIESIENIQTVIIGGMDRGINYQKLIDYLPNSCIRNIIFLPDSGKRIKDELDKLNINKNLLMVNYLEEAVKLADKITENGGVLLSPAAASYSVYKNFEERGNHFKECFYDIMLSNIEVLYHSSIRLSKNKIIYIDPYGIDKNYNDADMIFITHDHYDHYSINDINKVKKDGTLIIIPEDLLDKTLQNGFTKEDILTVIPNNKYNIGNINFETILSYNINKEYHLKENKWVGYIIELDKIKYYIAGDTDITDENKDIVCDVALIPIGGTFTMDFKEAATLINYIKPKIAIPIHYGSIVGTKENAIQFLELVNPEIIVKILMK